MIQSEEFQQTLEQKPHCQKQVIVFEVIFFVVGFAGESPLNFAHSNRFWFHWFSKFVQTVLSTCWCINYTASNHVEFNFVITKLEFLCVQTNGENVGCPNPNWISDFLLLRIEQPKIFDLVEFVFLISLDQAPVWGYLKRIKAHWIQFFDCQIEIFIPGKKHQKVARISVGPDQIEVPIFPAFLLKSTFSFRDLKSHYSHRKEH